ncbi:MAG TPA: alpha/beta fold hydrolase [Nitrospirota bacterium]|nr:alpha/beta fold hydrolase [Nitrospirota bacterium]
MDRVRWPGLTHARVIFSLQILIITIFVIPGCDLQNKMLYYPSQSVPSQEALAADKIAFWPSGIEGYRGFVSIGPANSRKGTVVVFHGNAGTAFDRAYYVTALVPLGFRVILPEYPAYGGRNGELGETAFVNDARETLRLALEKFGGPIFVLGESLGCGVVASVAKDAPVPIDGIILITPWDTLLSVAKEKFPWLPVRLFLRDKYDTVGNMKAFTGRMAVVGADRDQIIPIRHALALYESLQGSRKMWIIKGAGHNDCAELVERSFWKELTDFIAG